MSRISERMASCREAGRAALIPFITAGDPAPAQTVGLMQALVRGGADIIELGLPFSDPMADGPTIQLASERALAAGTTLQVVLDIVRAFRQEDSSTPVVLMGYLNPMLRRGAEDFARQLAEAGCDGVLAVDLALEEAGSLQPALRAAGLDCIFLLAPTTSLERAEQMSELGSGYLYYVSLKGVTGSAALDTDAVARRLDELRGVVKLPLAVGFGVREPAQAAALARCAEGVVVGSALVEQIAAGADSPQTLPDRLSLLVSELREGIESVA